MNKILFVGKFNEQTKKIQHYLAEFVSIQLCSDNVAIAKSMVGVYEPDLVLVNLEGLEQGHGTFFEEMVNHHGEIPILAVGSAEEWRMFGDYHQVSQLHYLASPVEGNTVLQEIARYIDVDVEFLPDGSVVARDERKMVLVVDDSPVILRSMKQMLEEKYRVQLATGGTQAMEVVKKHLPDLVILDYEMPECDGKQTLEMIRQSDKTKDIPVVFLTGHSDAEHIRSVIDLNPSAYFLKPPKADKIFEVLDKLL